MKQLKIKYGKKQVIITKDIITVLMGAAILLVDALLAGFLQLFEFGFDMSYLMTSEFWTAYAIKLVISYVALFGAYIIRKVIDRKTPKFVVQREKIKDSKNAIVKARKIGNCKNWLKYVYNYKKKVEIYQDIITRKYEKLVYAEPEQPDKSEFQLNTFCGKVKFNKATKKYKKQLKKYKKTEEMRKYCEEQLAVCDKHFEIIDAYKKHDIKKVKELQAQIKDIDCMKNYRLHYKNVTYNRLFNVDLGKTQRDDGIEYNEASVLTKKIVPAIFGGIVSCAMLTSIIVKPAAYTIETFLLIVLNLLLMLWFMFCGLRIADSFIFGVVYAADNNRLIICEEFIEDSALNGDNWVQEIDTSVEPEVVDDKTTQEQETEQSTPDDEVEPMSSIHIPIVRAHK